MNENEKELIEQEAKRRYPVDADKEEMEFKIPTKMYRQFLRYAFKEGAQFNHNLAKQSEIRWIKATEHLPTETSARISWRFTNKSIGGLAFDEKKGFAFEGKRTKDYKNIEWLYEPKQPEPNQ